MLVSVGKTLFELCNRIQSVNLARKGVFLCVTKTILLHRDYNTWARRNMKFLFLCSTRYLAKCSADSTWVDKSWRKQTFMNSKENIADS